MANQILPQPPAPEPIAPTKPQTRRCRCTKCGTRYHHLDWDLSVVRCLAARCRAALEDFPFSEGVRR